MSLNKEITYGALWSIVDKGGQQIVSFVVFLVMVRLIGPEEYGLAMVCFIYLSLSILVLSVLSDGVISLQIKNGNELTSLFWIILGVGFFLCSLCLGISYVMYNFSNNKMLGALLSLMSIIPILLSLLSIPQSLIIQKMQFRANAIRTLVATITSGIAGILLAYNGFGAFSLIIQQIVLYAVSNIVLWSYVSWRPTFTFKQVNTLTNFKPGINLLYSICFTFLEEQAPRFIINIILNATSVGFYSFSYRMKFALQEITTMPILTTFYPALSRTKGDQNQQQKILDNIFFTMFFLVVPAFCFASLLAPIYAPLLFGEKWNNSILLLQIFLLSGSFAPIAIIMRTLCRTYLLVNKFVRLQAFVVISYLLSVAVIAQFGIIYIGWLTLFTSILTTPMYIYYVNKWINLNILNALYCSLKSLFGTIISICFTYLIMLNTPDNSGWLYLLELIFSGAIFYIITNIILQRKKMELLFNFAKNKTYNQ